MDLQITTLSKKTGSEYLAFFAKRAQWVDQRWGLETSPWQWTGRGAAELGLHGPASDSHLRAVLLERQRPGTDEYLLRRQGNIAAYALTFRAPKDLSRLFADGSDEVAKVVRGCQEGAVTATIDYLQRGVRRSTSGEGGHVVTPAPGLVGASLTYQADNRRDGPGLRTAVLVANLAQGTDGRWTTVNGRDLHLVGKAVAGHYDWQLREALSASLGVEWKGGRMDPIGRRDPMKRGSLIIPPLNGLQGLDRLTATSSGSGVAPIASSKPEVMRLAGQLDRGKPMGPIEGPSPGGIIFTDATRAIEARPPAKGPIALGRTPGSSDLPRAMSSETSAYLRNELGPLPSQPGPLAAWWDGVQVIERYRTRWGVTPGTKQALGATPLRDMTLENQLPDYIKTTGNLAEIRQRLAPEQRLGLERGDDDGGRGQSQGRD
jgi:hypothetical protein